MEDGEQTEETRYHQQRYRGSPVAFITKVVKLTEAPKDFIVVVPARYEQWVGYEKPSYAFIALSIVFYNVWFSDLLTSSCLMVLLT